MGEIRRLEDALKSGQVPFEFQVQGDGEQQQQQHANGGGKPEDMAVG